MIKRALTPLIKKLSSLYPVIAITGPRQSGQFIITGSQQFELSEKISQSLAGRVANFTLLPLAISEIGDIPTYEKLAIHGFYPRIYDRPIPPKDYYRDYLSTYVERDVRQIKNIGDLSSFQRFLHLVAGRVG